MMRPTNPKDFRMDHHHLPGILMILALTAGMTMLSGQWEPDMPISLGGANAYTSFNHEHNLAATGDTVHAVWFDARHGWPAGEIYYRRSLDAGVSWGPEARLTNNGIYDGYPSIAASGQTLHVVWFSSDNDDDNIWYIRSTDAGGTWQPDTQLTVDITMQDFPSVTASGSNVHVIYHDERNGNWEVYYLRSTDAGVTWGPETRLTNDPGWSNNSCIVVNGPLVHLAWSDDRASTAHFDIYYKRSTDYGTTWGTDTRLTTTFNSGGPSLDRSGPNLFLGFQSERDGNTEMFFKRSTNDGIDWLADVQLTDDPALRQLPAIAAADHNVHLVWQDYRSGTLPEIYYKRSTNDGTTWETDLRLTFDTQRSIWPGIAIRDSVVHVIWSDDRPGYYNIYYKRNPTGNPTGLQEHAGGALEPGPPGMVIFPNPFQDHGRVLTRDNERFSVFDIAGTWLGESSGDRIGEHLPAGVYFIRSSRPGEMPARCVKIK